MRNVICVLLVVLLPLSLASNTQHRFKVYVYVSGNGDVNQAVNTVESHLKRELCLLGDVDIVGADDDWEYFIDLFLSPLNYTDGRETGEVVIGTYSANRLNEFHYKLPKGYKVMQATWGGVLGVAFYHRENLPEFCIGYVNRFDKRVLDRIRARRPR